MKPTSRLLTILFAFFILSAAAMTVLAAGSPVFDVDKEFYPYYPSLIKWNKSNVPSMSRRGAVAAIPNSTGSGTVRPQPCLQGPNLSG